ncbi:MAG: SseB family protein [Pseudomonadota bacterium]
MLPTPSKITLQGPGNTPSFEPLNALETSLSNVQKKVLARHDFIQTLLESELVVSSVTEIMPDGSGFLPLLLKKLNVQMLVCFTEEERIGKHEQTAPYYVSILGKDLLKRLPNGFGLVINPGLSVSFEISPDEAQQIVKAF